jgi:hypothetical protein
MTRPGRSVSAARCGIRAAPFASSLAAGSREKCGRRSRRAPVRQAAVDARPQSSQGRTIRRGGTSEKKPARAWTTFDTTHTLMSSWRGIACERSPNESLAGGRQRVVQTRRMTRVDGRRVHRAGSPTRFRRRLGARAWNRPIQILAISRNSWYSFGMIKSQSRFRAVEGEPIPATSRASGAAWKRQRRNFLFESAITP